MSRRAGNGNYLTDFVGDQLLYDEARRLLANPQPQFKEEKQPDLSPTEELPESNWHADEPSIVKQVADATDGFYAKRDAEEKAAAEAAHRKANPVMEFDIESAAKQVARATGISQRDLMDGAKKDASALRRSLERLGMREADFQRKVEETLGKVVGNNHTQANTDKQTPIQHSKENDSK